MNSLAGEPKRVVCDAHRAMLQAAGERWPNAELHQCEWHLQHALKRLLTKELRKASSGDLAELAERADGALAGPGFWRSFVDASRAVENESLDRWIAVNVRRSKSSSLGAFRPPGARPRCP